MHCWSGEDLLREKSSFYSTETHTRKQHVQTTTQLMGYISSIKILPVILLDNNNTNKSKKNLTIYICFFQALNNKFIDF